MRRIIGQIILVISLFVPALSNADTLGDINSDEKIDLTEAIYALRVVAGDEPIPTDDSLVGAWWSGSTSTEVGGIMVLVFLNNGTYIHVQNGDDVNAAWDGYEYGTYTYDTMTKILVPTVIIDMNGEVGFSNMEGQMTVEIDGDVATIAIENNTGTDVLYRVK